MDAQIFQIDEQRHKRHHATYNGFPVLDVMRATQSAAAFFTWYAGALLSFHVAVLRSAVERMEP